jgi:hypothetical protein
VPLVVEIPDEDFAVQVGKAFEETGFVVDLDPTRPNLPTIQESPVEMVRVSKSVRRT